MISHWDLKVMDMTARADQVSDLQRGLQDICPTLFPNG